MSSQVAVVNTSAAVATTRPVRSRFYFWMALVAIGVVLAGFAPTYIYPAGRNGPPTALILLHTALFGAWLLLFLVQTALIGRGRVATHRRLGAVAALLAPAMIVVAYMTARATARRGFDLSGDLNVANDPLAYLVFPLGDILSFTILVGAALWYRHRPAVHKRLMLLATAGSLMAAPLAHLIGFLPALRETRPIILLPLGALYMASAIGDKVLHRRIHPVSLWGGILLLVYANVRAAVIAPSAVWHDFAAWLIR